MYEASAMSNAARPGYSERDNAGTNAKIMSDADGPEGAKGKVDITMLDKTNKIFILVSY